jgi:SAM-dependent methyltransferase
MSYSFSRYLAAKRPIDDRSLNHHVWQTVRHALPAGPLAVLEVGAGIGTMIDRLHEGGLLAEGSHYTAVDAEPALLAEGQNRLAARELAVTLELVSADVHAFARRARGRRAWDLLVAHAFLDLVDAAVLLPELFALLRPGGLFWFTINFDGLTALEPPVDPGFDDLVIDHYHRTMDERQLDGRPTSGSRAGRALLRQIPAAGGHILAAGASDWVVMPHAGHYPGDEAYFLHHMLHFFELSLTGRAELDPDRLAAWLARRRAQIDAGELALIVHQIDVAGVVGNQ